jgi:hypothetical protein
MTKDITARVTEMAERFGLSAASWNNCLSAPLGDCNAWPSLAVAVLINQKFSSSMSQPQASTRLPAVCSGN